MFSQKFGTLTLMEMTTTTGKKMLGGFRKDGTRLLMDITSSAIPDGQTSYMFDNKLIITVHWSDYTPEDIAATFHNTINLRMGLLESGLCLFVKFGSYKWGDILNLPGLMSSFNDPEKEFDEVIFVFIDSADGRIIGVREIPINGEIAELIAYGNMTSYFFFDKSPYKKRSYRLVSELHSDWCNAAADDLRIARNIDFEAMQSASGIYGIDVDENDFAKFYKY